MMAKTKQPKPQPPNPSWVVPGWGEMKCARCGDTDALQAGAGVNSPKERADRFIEKHRFCSDPSVPQATSFLSRER